MILKKNLNKTKKFEIKKFIIKSKFNYYLSKDKPNLTINKFHVIESYHNDNYI